MQHFAQNYCDQKQKYTILSLACGNGWQDRDLVRHIHEKKYVGVDVSKELIKSANNQKPNNNFEYKIKNLNTDKLGYKDHFDIAINLAGLHHVENMEHIMQETHKALKPGGYFVHYEYIGPKRNQYPDKQLKLMNWMQHQFPQYLVGRSPITKPSLEVMLKEDPSEAIGSELIIPSLKKLFKIIHLQYLNGGMLYQVLYNQVQNFDQNNKKHNKLLADMIKIEENYTKQGKSKPLFAYIIAQKK